MLCAAAVCLLTAGPALAQVTFYPVAELTPRRDVKPSVRGAIEANPKDWPASFYAFLEGRACTGTFVADRILLTAAHCVAEHRTITLRTRVGLATGECEAAPLYDMNPTADWALCEFDARVSPGPFERVAAGGLALKVGSVILLTGFGCTTAQGTGGNDNVFRIGWTNLSRLVVPPSLMLLTSGEAALCFGDSGGAAFLVTDKDVRNRVQVSVNGSVGRDGRGTLTKTSHLASLAVAPAQAFLREWAAARGVLICGLHAQAQSCR